METISRNPVFQSVKIYFPQKKNIPIGGIKDIDCNTKSNLLIIEFPIIWFRKTQYITSIGLFYKKWGSFPQRTPNMRNIILLTDIVSAYTEILSKY
tara:strand:+ start:51 stop:338 length:288 start_codon:yes stop_codon:yes gene_type:complete